MYSSTAIFNEGLLSEFFENKKRGISQDISKKQTYIDNDTRVDLLEKSKMKTLFLNEEKISRTEPKEITLNRTDNDIYSLTGSSYQVKGLTVTFFIPFVGDQNTLLYLPTKYSLPYPDGLLNQNKIEIRYETTTIDGNKIKSLFENDLELIRNMIKNVNNDIEQYNNGLESFINNEIDRRNVAIEQKSNFDKGLGYPVAS